MHILDIVQNAVAAQSGLVEVLVEENEKTDTYIITITDNGKGIDKAVIEKVTDPFFTSWTTRKVGMGISLFKQNAEQAGGHFSIDSKIGEGTKVRAVFQLSNIDRPIMGDIAGTMTLLIGANPDIRFIYTHKTGIGNFELYTQQVLEELEGVPISHPDILRSLKYLISENPKMIEAKIT